MKRVLCGWLWLHDDPAWRRTEAPPRDHECVRPPAHPGPHSCWCGDKP